MTVLAARRKGTGIMLALTRDGRLASREALDRIATAAGSATDCFVFCHGWLHDVGDARQAARRFFALLDAALAPLGDRVVPLRVALHWPSKPFADPDLTRGPGENGLWPRLERRLDGKTGGSTDVAEVLLDVCSAEIPASPEEEAELDLLLRRLSAPHTRGAWPLSPFHALSFWAMKRRAGEVGERFGRETLAPLWRALPHPPRLHLIGHSFGAKLVTSAVLGGARPTSLTLLLGAFSAFAFAPDIPGFRRPGFYHPVLAGARVAGPIVVLHSPHDTALATFYRALTPDTDIGRPSGTALPPGAGRAKTVVATTALGAVGARGGAAPNLGRVDAPPTGIPSYPIVNVDGARVVRAREPFVGAHRDVFHPEVATLVGMAAGLLVGGPVRARPVPLDPRVRRVTREATARDRWPVQCPAKPGRFDDGSP